MPFSRHSRGSRIYGTISEHQNDPPPTTGRVRSPSRRWLRWPVIKRFLQVVIFCLLLGFVVVAGLVLWVSRDLPDPSKLPQAEVAESTKIYDRTGQHLLYEVYQNQKRTVVTLSQMSTWLPKAFVAVEDKNFYQNNGIEIGSIIRAGFNDLIGHKVGSGGASTITQQLIKNTIVGNERSIVRKIKEAILALRLSQKYSKDEILQLYLNEIPLGETNYGVEAAAQSYFHKSSADLTLDEAAALAALNQAPTYYLDNLDALQARRNTVLELMFEQGYITAEQKQSAESVALHIYHNQGIYFAPHFVNYVKEQLVNQFGEQLVDTGGLKVITTLDYDKQQIAQNIVKTEGDKLAKSANADNAALVAIDPKTAQILALVGSRDYNDDSIDGQYDVAVLGKRQPGSSLKPFVYTLAFQDGFTPDTGLYDVKTNFGAGPNGQQYSPKDYDGKEHGYLTMRTALQNSLNIPAVKTLYLVGVDNAVNFLKRFGYTTLDGENCGLSLVLGGCEVNLLQHTNAYAALADNGVYHQPVSILKVEDANGNVLSQWQPNPGTVAITPDLDATISNVLSDNQARAMIFGLHSTLVLPDRPVAAKTGTTNDAKDAWTMGYVPSLAAGVWVGNTIPAPMNGEGSSLAGLIWNQFMQQALASTTPEQFPPAPSSTPNLKPVLRAEDGGIQLPIDTATGNIATSSTPPNFITEKTFLPPHSILYYVDKNNPNGPPPADPTTDSQYAAWEEGVQNWAAEQMTAGKQIVFADPPTTYDAPASPGLAPTLTVVSPVAGQVITSPAISFAVNASAPRGVTEVLYYIDGTLVAASTQYPFQANYSVYQLMTGQHTLRVIAEDDQGNSTSIQVPFDYEGPLASPSVEWVDSSPLSLAQSDFPRAMSLAPFRWESISTIAIYLDGGSGEKLIYTFSHPADTASNGHLAFVWQHNPGPGTYTLRAVMTTNQGQTEEKDLQVTVQ